MTPGQFYFFSDSYVMISHLEQKEEEIKEAIASLDKRYPEKQGKHNYFLDVIPEVERIRDGRTGS